MLDLAPLVALLDLELALDPRDVSFDRVDVALPESRRDSGIGLRVKRACEREERLHGFIDSAKRRAGEIRYHASSSSLVGMERSIWLRPRTATSARP